LSHRVLNRTLLQRQHLLARTDLDPLSMTEHLLGLQAQEPLPPYLSLAARLDRLDPATVSAALEERRAVRVLLMRGTIHLVTSTDAVQLRAFVQPALDRVSLRSQASRPAAPLSRESLHAAVRACLVDGPRPVSEIGEHLSGCFPGVPVGALTNAARETLALVQVPPRGLWQRSGGVVYQTMESWLGPDAGAAPDVGEVVRRYLRAFGPATPADLTTWSGVSGMRAVFQALVDELVVHVDDEGRRLYDLAGLDLADPDVPAPVRMLGRYDNVWLSHDRRDRVTPDPDKRKRWMGVNGGVAATVFVDGVLEGLWRRTPSGSVEVELFRPLSRAERTELDVEVGRLESLLSRP
jgi:hypothetical protein